MAMRMFSLTPRFIEGFGAEGELFNRFNGFLMTSQEGAFHVDSLLFSLLATLGLDNFESRENAIQRGRRSSIKFSITVHRGEWDLHEDQLCEPRTCACLD